MVNKVYKSAYKFGQAVANVQNEYKRVQKMKEVEATDVEKHRYISCLAGQAGPVGQGAILGLGVAKEVIDFSSKSLSSEQRRAYHGISGIWRDGVKDMKNNYIGSSYGVRHSEDGACLKLLKKRK